MNAYPHGALRHYQNAAVVGAANSDVAPQKLIDMLLDGALQRLNTARGCVLVGDTVRKVPLLASALGIIEHLRLCLDHQAGGEIARNLDALYDYMGRRLLKANLDNDAAGIEEVADLLRTVKSAWEQVGTPRR
ncbi:MAG TPA: flagellar export chaperone FliS [Solimonas sp.]|nr:flagellar export chaperone FliS [Solimonas sp.]